MTLQSPPPSWLNEAPPPSSPGDYGHETEFAPTTANGAGSKRAAGTAQNAAYHTQAAAVALKRAPAGAPPTVERLDDHHRPQSNHAPAAPDSAETSDDGVSMFDFYAHMPTHSYIFAPSREFWPGASVNARIVPVQLFDARGLPLLDDKGKARYLPASAWLDKKRPVEQMTWAPGEPMVIRDRLITLEGGWIKRPGCACFNLYRAPTVKPGDATKASPWIEHVHRVYPGEAEHIIKWLAHRVQRPEEKINHALVLGGAQGVGKDTILEPVKIAIGPWNFSEVSPQHVLGRFNGFVKSVVLRVSEARDLGDVDRFSFYDHMKTLTAAPPDVLRVDEKHLREYSVANVCGVIITTNHKSDGIYLPPDDRRHFVAWSETTRDDFSADYWNQLYRWYGDGGIEHVTAYLAELDLSSFDPKAPPEKTAAFWAIADANRSPEDAELADVLDALGNPDATTLQKIIARADGDFADWLRDRKNRRKVPHRMEEGNYVPVRNPSAVSGLWVVGGKRQVIYARKSLSLRDQIYAAQLIENVSGSDVEF